MANPGYAAVAPSAPVPTTLEVRDVEVVYDGIIAALHGVTLDVHEGGVATLLGPNGAGKTTTLRAISGLLGAERGEIVRGTIAYRGRALGRRAASHLAREGLVHVLEGRHCFPSLTVEENLATGAFVLRSSRRALAAAIEETLARFPKLRDRRRTAAGHLSGGEQQMLAIGRALIARPSLLVLDEPSMGLAPKVVEEIFALLRDLNEREGLTLLIAEQNASAALAIADVAYVLENGRVAVGGTAASVRSRSDVRELYLGRSAGGRARFRERPSPA